MIWPKCSDIHYYARSGPNYGQRGYAAGENCSASLSQSATRFHLGQIWAITPSLGCGRRIAAGLFRRERFSLSIGKRPRDSGQDCDPHRFAVGAAIRRSSSKKLRMKTSRSCGRSNEPSSGATATRSPSGCRSNERCPVCGPM